MTLPSTKRPKEVEEEIRAARLALEKDACPKLVLRTSKLEIFRRTMEEWYMGLTDKHKRRLTAKELKRKAVNVCYANGIVYDLLPTDWISQLETKCGLSLFKKVKATVEKAQSKSVISSDPIASAVARKGSNHKVFLDYSLDSPPPAWLEAYSTGVILPRMLSLISTNDANILFYDYNPKLKDSFGRSVKLMPKPRAPELKNVLYFNKQKK